MDEYPEKHLVALSKRLVADVCVQKIDFLIRNFHSSLVKSKVIARVGVELTLKALINIYVVDDDRLIPVGEIYTVTIEFGPDK